MKFRSEIERMRHPQASLIPRSLWSNFRLFVSEISDEALALMQVDTRELITQAQAIAPKLQVIRQKTCAWLAIALSHRELTPELLRHISRLFRIDEVNLFFTAIVWGNISFIETLITIYSRTGQLQAMIAAWNYGAFREAAEGGHFDVLNRIWDLISADNRQAMIAADHYGVFVSAARGGNLAVLNRIWELASADKRQAMIAACNYEAFREAAEGGHFDVLNRIWDLTSADNRQAMIAADDYGAFVFAARRGNLAELNRIWDLTSTDNRQAMIGADDYIAFSWAAEGGHFDVLNRIWDLTSADNRQAMITAENYQAFRWAVCSGVLAVVNRLLQFTLVFAYAEMHVPEYGEGFVNPFLANKLFALSVTKVAVEAENPNAVFDITDAEEAKLCFYMLRNLIRRNNPALLDDIRFLLEIPAVKILVHTAVTPREPNELLRLALTTQNQPAAELLLTLPAVNALAEQNNYYRNEMRGGMDLTVLAQDRESSMRALSTGEQQRLQAAIERYQPLIKQAGVPNIMNDLRQTLETRYAERPAMLNRDDAHPFELPLKWDNFKALELTPSEKKQALEAYYQHKDHTAWRYLSKPNSWMHEEAAYVCVSDNGRERWSTFVDYQPLISMLYLAAQDTTIAPIDGHTLETRLNHFIDELALIGRAHNWDDTRDVTDEAENPIFNEDGETITEEFDNLEGDRPSCFSGVKRRLFQAVQGHPLLKMLTKEVVEEEIRDFVRQHCTQKINESNRATLKQVWDKYIDGAEMNVNDWSTLKTLDIAAEQQQAFIDSLVEKYGAQFEGENTFIKQVKNTFAYKGKENEDAHVLNFGYLHIEQLFESPASPATPSSAGFFAVEREDNEG